METHLLKGTFPFEDAKCDLACQFALSALLEQLGRYATENAQSDRTLGIQNGFGRSAQPCLRSLGRKSRLLKVNCNLRSQLFDTDVFFVFGMLVDQLLLVVIALEFDILPLSSTLAGLPT